MCLDIFLPRGYCRKSSLNQMAAESGELPFELFQSRELTAARHSSKALCVPLAAAQELKHLLTEVLPREGLLCCLSRAVSVPDFVLCAGCCFKAFKAPCQIRAAISSVICAVF